MYNGSRILAVIPARGGSKGVPLKNVHPLAGDPLIVHTARVVKAVGEIDRAVVSTDHDVIAAAATDAGLDVPFRRPAELGGDRVGDLDVLCHALESVEIEERSTYDVVLMLQPTSPLRRAEHVRAVIQAIVDGRRDSVWTVSRTDLKYHPKKQLEVNGDGRLSYFCRDAGEIVARQQLTPTYYRNGAAYAFSRACLLEQRTILGADSAAVVVEDEMISIDTLDDFARVERIMTSRAAAR